MAAIAENLTLTELAPTKRKGRSRKALKPKTPTSNEANIAAGEIPVAPQLPENSAGKENQKKGRSKKALKPKTASSNEAITAAGEIPVAAELPENSAGKENQDALSKKKTKKGASKKGKQQVKEMQEQLEKLKIETEENLKAKDESLKHEEEEREKLQKIKPTDTVEFPPIPTTSGEGKALTRPIRNKKLPEKFKDFKMG
ncbi:hypothetical protein C2S52_008349 [Perilla frutescens var. hirtella]|nr:hypothetical protein C2S51_017921 [Perilla frutescens var. frutescens]KAH6783390.1 hypothetical protein C2S52_008349 [Perilla frutescens var. hirtella]